MKNSKKEEKIVKEIQKKFGSVIDLTKTPFVIIEILRNYGRIFDEDGGGGGGGMGGGTGVSTMAVGITPDSDGHIGNAILLKEILKLQKQIQALNRKIK